MGFYHGHNWEQVNTGLAWVDLTAYLFGHLTEIASLDERQISIEEIQAAWEEELTPDLERFGRGLYTIVIPANWPLHTLLNAVALKLLGVEIQSLGLLTAFFGWLCIPVFYLVGRSYADHRLGIACALFVAVSASALILSRTVYDGQQFVPFFCGLMLALYLRSIGAGAERKAYLIGVGIMVGLGIGVQPVAMPFCGSLLLFELISGAREGWRKNTGRLLAIGGGLVFTLILLEMPYAFVTLVLGKNCESLYPGLRGFWATYSYLIGKINYEHTVTFSIISFLGSYLIYETVINSVLLVVGSLIVARRWREKKNALLLFLVAIPTTYWVLISRNPPESRHYLSAMLPILVLFCALGFVRVCSEIARRWPRKGALEQRVQFVGAIGGIVVILVSFRNLEPVYDASRGLQKASQWLKETGSDRVVVFGECEPSFDWLQYDVHTECLENNQALRTRYLATIPRYASEQERAFQSGCEKLDIRPLYDVSHLWPQERLFEYQAAQSAFMCAFGRLPFVGPRLERIRQETLTVNVQRRILLFDMKDDRIQELLKGVSASAVAMQETPEVN